MHTVYLSLGSNLGDREATMRRAIGLLNDRAGSVDRQSSFIETEPWGFDSNLLLGYYCEVDGGTSITMDETELATARFVKRDKIEEDKNLLSLTATMIDRFRKGLE